MVVIINPPKEAAMPEPRTPTGFTADQLRAIFDDVHDPDDWRAPIAVWCAGESVLAICESIRFMTGTEPKVALDTTRMRYLITSEGYRNGPCGP